MTSGTLTLPQALAVVGIVPGLILIIFCGVFALFTSLLLIDFKWNHPEVHNMGDAGECSREITSDDLRTDPSKGTFSLLPSA